MPPISDAMRYAVRLAEYLHAAFSRISDATTAFVSAVDKSSFVPSPAITKLNTAARNMPEISSGRLPTLSTNTIPTAADTNPATVARNEYVNDRSPSPICLKNVGPYELTNWPPVVCWNQNSSDTTTVRRRYVP